MGTSVEVIVMATYKHINPKYLKMYQDIPVLIRLLEFDMVISLDLTSRGHLRNLKRGIRNKRENNPSNYIFHRF